MKTNFEVQAVHGSPIFPLPATVVGNFELELLELSFYCVHIYANVLLPV